MIFLHSVSIYNRTTASSVQRRGDEERLVFGNAKIGIEVAARPLTAGSCNHSFPQRPTDGGLWHLASNKGITVENRKMKVHPQPRFKKKEGVRKGRGKGG